MNKLSDEIPTFNILRNRHFYIWLGWLVVPQKLNSKLERICSSESGSSCFINGGIYMLGGYLRGLIAIYQLRALDLGRDHS